MLGRNGDILSILPCLQQEFKETGVKPILVVSKDYAELTKSIPWLVTEVFDGGFDFLGNALRWAKSRGKVDFIPQVHGVGYPHPARKHPSFQLCQWDRMGRLHQWNELTLELPRTDFKLGGWNSDIADLPSILFADHSQSSPFPHVTDLFESLKKEFPRHHVQRLSTLRFPHLLDCLALYDASDLIVTIDTAHLHMSRATKTPVIALVTDVPGTWWGSAYHPRFAMHCRYRDYELRKSELLFTAKRVVKNKS